MKIHELKTDPDMFSMTISGVKNFEIRKDDRGFELGDLLILKETKFSGAAMGAGAPLVYTGRQVSRFVNYILPAGSYGLSPGWVVMRVDKI